MEFVISILVGITLAYKSTIQKRGNEVARFLGILPVHMPAQTAYADPDHRAILKDWLLAFHAKSNVCRKQYYYLGGKERFLLLDAATKAN